MLLTQKSDAQSAMLKEKRKVQEHENQTFGFDFGIINLVSFNARKLALKLTKLRLNISFYTGGGCCYGYVSFKFKNYL